MFGSRGKQAPTPVEMTAMAPQQVDPALYQAAPTRRGLFGRRKPPLDPWQAEQRRSMRTRRLIGFAIMLGLFWGLYWLFFHTPVGTPIAENIGPYYTKAMAVINGSEEMNWKGYLASAAVFVVPHIGFIMFLLDET